MPCQGITTKKNKKGDLPDIKSHEQEEHHSKSSYADRSNSNGTIAQGTGRTFGGHFGQRFTCAACEARMVGLLGMRS